MLNRKIRILGIAPYESLKNTMIRVAGERDDIDLTVEVGNIEAGAAVAKRYEGEDFDAILSRGGTKIEIEKVTSKPVFDIPISYYDLLNVIRLVENYKGKVALISYENIARSARVICDILHTQYDIFIIDSWRSSAETVRKLKEEGYSLIIGDVVSVTHAEDQGLQSMLLISGADSVRQAFDTVVQVCSHYSRLRQENAFFQAFVHSREDRLLAMDKDGNVVFSTFPAGDPFPQPCQRPANRDHGSLFCCSQRWNRAASAHAKAPAPDKARFGAPILQNFQGQRRLLPLVKAAVDDGVDGSAGMLRPQRLQLHQAGEQMGGDAIHIQGTGDDPHTGALQRFLHPRGHITCVKGGLFGPNLRRAEFPELSQQDAAGAVFPFGAGINERSGHSVIPPICSGVSKKRTSATLPP